MSFGSAMYMPYAPRRSISIAAAVAFADVNKCRFRSLSHIGWCQLKLPNQSIESSVLSLPCCWVRSCCRHLSRALRVSECAQSLYILKRCMVVLLLVSLIPVRSPESDRIGIHVSVEIRLLTRIIERVFLGFSKCLVGYTTSQYGLACVRPRKSM